MGQFDRKIDLPIGSLKPIIMNVFEDEKGTTVDGTGALTPKFNLWNLDTDTSKVADIATGTTINQENPLKLKHVLQSDESDEGGRFSAWFSYVLGGVTEKTTAFEVTFTKAQHRFR